MIACDVGAVAWLDLHVCVRLEPSPKNGQHRIQAQLCVLDLPCDLRTSVVCVCVRVRVSEAL